MNSESSIILLGVDVGGGEEQSVPKKSLRIGVLNMGSKGRKNVKKPKKQAPGKNTQKKA